MSKNQYTTPYNRKFGMRDIGKGLCVEEVIYVNLQSHNQTCSLILYIAQLFSCYKHILIKGCLLIN